MIFRKPHDDSIILQLHNWRGGNMTIAEGRSSRRAMAGKFHNEVIQMKSLTQ
jgi:hypothetical protein